MYGPLNGVRTALVIAAFFAAMAALIVGRPGVALILLGGVVIHGLGWVYLYRQAGRVDRRP